MREIPRLKNTIIFGFDSAWADNQPGAICAITYDETSKCQLHEPRLVFFSQALDYISCKEKSGTYDLSLIALDQSLFVNNLTGMRPVEKIAGSPIGWAGGGVQPSNKSRQGMFDDNAPIWAFQKSLKEKKYKLDLDDVLSIKKSKSGKSVIEVFPALALLGLSEKFFTRYGAPKYNPEKKRKFKKEDWISVCDLLAKKSNDLELIQLSKWAETAGKIPEPKKEDQDKLDAAICALIGLIWIACDESCSMMIGNMQTGYMITPVIEKMRIRLEEASQRHGIIKI